MRTLVIKILNFLSKKIIAKYKPVVVVVVGCAGKSSTVQILNQVLGGKYEIRGNNSVYADDISIPLSIIGVDSGRRSVMNWLKIFYYSVLLLYGKTNFYPDMLIFELDIVRAGDVDRFLRLAHPNVVVCTGAGFCEVNNLSDKIFLREFSILFKSLNKKDFLAYNQDSSEVVKLAKLVRSQKMSFGFDSESVVRGEEVGTDNVKWKMDMGKIGMSFKIISQGTMVPIRFFYALGRGHIYAALAGTTIALHFGLNMVEVSENLSKYVVLPGRMNLIKGFGGSLLIDDTYSTTPESFAVALEGLKKIEAQRRLVVVGQGVCDDANYISNIIEHLRQMSVVEKIYIYCHITDKKMFVKVENSRLFNVIEYHDKKELMENIKVILRGGDVVLIKGKKAQKMASVVRGIMLEPELAEQLLMM